MLKRFWNKCKHGIISHPIVWPFTTSVLSASPWLVQFRYLYSYEGLLRFEDAVLTLLFSIMMAVFVHYPVLLTLLNIYFLFKPKLGDNSRRVGHIVEYTTIVIGMIFVALYQDYHHALDEYSSVWFNVDYYTPLYVDQKHTPIFTEAWPTLIAIIIVALVGYIILRVVPLTKQPPLVTVLSMSAVYMLIAFCVVFIVQTGGISEMIFPLCLYAFVLIIISLKVIREITGEWRNVHPADDATQFGGKKPLLALNKILCKAGGLPIFALILALPLLGVIIAILVLTGQAPDAIIQAWTQTADWNLSQQIAPPNMEPEGHYLCTVAAGGHQKVVKPLRNGKRHGHDVIVNRQLCVANAFEQLIQERVPRFHKFIRGVYDKYGYPISRHIKSKTAADVVYFVMKPLEWVFLAVLYLCDTHPENRIAVQYPHAPLPDKLKFERK